MTDALYLRLKSLNTRTVRGVTSPKNIVRVAAMHNLREIQAELGASAASGINPARMHLNYQLRGPATAEQVAGLALALLDNAGITTLRRDACMALELVFSLPPGASIDHREYFGAAVVWADIYFNVPIISAAVHLDEATPHCHVLLLPLVAGRMQGGALAGGPAKIRAMLADFQQQVGQRFGLTHQPRAKRLSKHNRDAAGRMVLEALRAQPERLSERAMRDALVAALGSQAEALLALLGLSMPATKAKAKSFADIMTAPCKPERVRRAAPNTKHIDVAQNLGKQGGEKFDNVYLCVDVAPSTAPIPPDGVQRQHPIDGANDTGQRYQDIDPQPSASKSEVRKSDIGPNASEAVHQRAQQQATQPNAVHRLDATTAPSSASRLPTGDATSQPGQVQAFRLAQPLAEAPESVFSTAGQSPDDSGDAQHGHQRPATPTEQRAEGEGSAARAKRSSGWPAPRKPAPAQDDGYTRQRDADQPAEHWDRERGEFAQATGPPGIAPSKRARVPFGVPPF